MKVTSMDLEKLMGLNKTVFLRQEGN